MSEKWPQVYKIVAKEGYASALYNALATVFTIPPLEILNSPEELEKWRYETPPHSYFAGPKVYRETRGYEILVVPERSDAEIYLHYRNGVPNIVGVIFPRWAMPDALQIETIVVSARVLSAFAEAIEDVPQDDINIHVAVYVSPEGDGYLTLFSFRKALRLTACAAEKIKAMQCGWPDKDTGPKCDPFDILYEDE